ncbi:MAG: TerB family tellurite resistance protein [Pseudomonadota bacterium]
MPGILAHALKLATAVLLVEVMRADGSFHAGECGAVLAGLRDKFALADDEAARLAELASQLAAASR